MSLSNKVLNPDMGGSIEKVGYSVELIPEIIIDEHGELILVFVLDEDRTFEDDDLVVQDFVDRYNVLGKGSAVLYTHAPLAELVDSERDLNRVGKAKLYDPKIKPKYDKIREELLKLVASIDQMEYHSEESLLTEKVNAYLEENLGNGDRLLRIDSYSEDINLLERTLKEVYGAKTYDEFVAFRKTLDKGTLTWK